MTDYSVYPSAIDGLSQLPLAVDKVTKIDAVTVNRLRDAIIKIEAELGVEPSGDYETVKARLADLEDQIGSFFVISSHKNTARAATTGNISNLATGAPNTVDDVSLSVADRILVWQQDNQYENGIYLVTSVGSGSNGKWRRATDANTASKLIPGSEVFVIEGTQYADCKFWLTTPGPYTLGTTNLEWIMGLCIPIDTGSFTQAEADALYDPLGAADTAVASHVAAADPHPNYALESSLGTISTQASSSVSITGGSITGITDLAIADGGTGASDAATARTNLGLGSISTQASSSVSITGGSITGITDLAVADGGTGASDAATARANLGIGTSGTGTFYVLANNQNGITDTFTDVTGVTFTPSANKIYLVRIYVLWTVALASTGMAYQLVGTGDVADAMWLHNPTAAGGGVFRFGSVGDGTGASGTASPQASVGNLAHGVAIVSCASSPPAAIKLQMKAETALTVNAIKGTCIEIIDITP